MPYYLNSEMEREIGEIVHSARDRTILRLKYIDGLTHERIAEIYDMSPRQIDNIVRRFREIAPIFR